MKAPAAGKLPTMKDPEQPSMKLPTVSYLQVAPGTCNIHAGMLSQITKPLDGIGTFRGLSRCKMLFSDYPPAQNQYMQEKILGELIFSRIHAGPVFALARIQENIFEESFTAY